MYIVFVVVAAVVVFAVAAAAVGRGDGLEEPFPDMERPYLPDGRIEPVDVDDVHFAVAFRGYRMDQVDSVLDRLSEELIRRDQHIARLERIVHTQTVQSATAYAPPRQSRLGLDHMTRADDASRPTDQAGSATATDRPPNDAGDNRLA
jgi:DivIVA domain-containing protein